MQQRIEKAAEMLKSRDNIVILTHQNPDGDTLGCAFALYFALRERGKRVRVENEKAIPKKYSFLYEGYEPEDFKAEFIVAVDIASESLFGRGMEHFEGKVDLCIDHHKSNTGYAEYTVLDSSVAAACEIVYDILLALDGKISYKSLTCIYTGISTDCGCFKYSNTTEKAHTVAAEAIERGIDVYKINQAMFESKSRAQLEIERTCMQKLKFYYNGKCALITVPYSLLEKTGAEECDLDALPALTRQIQGVEVGVVIKERSPGECKISLRTGKRPDASTICSELGGGGHAAAAGCTVWGSVSKAEEKIVETIGRYL